MNDHQIDLLARWETAAAEAKKLKTLENKLRVEVLDEFLEHPKEGTNYVDLDQGYRLKFDIKLNRKIDEAALPAVLKELPEGTEDSIIARKPTLKVGDYKKMSEEHRRKVDEALIIKPASPAITIIPPKEG